MDASAWVAVGAAIIALLSGWYTGRSAKAAEKQADEARHQTKLTAKSAEAAEKQADEARRQTELQRRLHEDAQQPYVWADVMPDTAQGTLLKLTVCNEGPTVATNIHIEFDPPFKTIHDPGNSADVQEMLSSGISYLAPKRRVQWVFDVGYEFLGQENIPTSRVTITCDGPHGSCPPNSYVIDPAYLKNSHDYPDGSLHRVAERIKDLTAVVKKRA